MSGRKPERTVRPRASARAGARPPRHPLPSGPGDARLFIPQGYEPGYAYPLLVWLPDPADAGFSLARTMCRVSLRNFVAVHPAASAAGNDEAVWRAIDGVVRRLSIHADRIYLVGEGAGGTAAFRIACRNPDSFAGVASLLGRFPLDEAMFAGVKRLRRLPMLLCSRRDADPESALLTDRTLRLFHAAGAALAMRIYPDGDDLAPPILADVNRWIMDEVCGTTAAQPACSAS